ncbi:MAG: DUF1080 domain-containing protein [Candidatus Omnitrophica bacterium]|nr:DUF1080 domain-containing protein [Candidatus Omnitrophota bacterium]
MKVRQFTNRLGLLVSAVFAFTAFCPVTWSGYPGKVIIKNNEIRWGQYKNVSGIRGVEFPDADSGDLSATIKDWPLSGASTVVLRCQKPGNRFFSGDGLRISSDRLERLHDNIVAVNAFDMLPLVMVFDPSLQCQLDEPEAYAKAAATLVDGLGDDCWYLLCLTDQLDDSDWKIQDSGTDPAESALGIATSLKAKHPDLILAAGGASSRVNSGLVKEGGPIDVVMGRVDSLELGEGGVSVDGAPFIETVSAQNLSSDDLKKAVSKVGFRRIDESFPYGFCVVYEDPDADMGKVQKTLDDIAPLVDQLQKEISEAIPPSEDMNADLDPKEAEEGFVSLFNGKDLSGWVPISQPDDFFVEDGVIQLQGFKGGWLRSWEPYSDFIFRGEYWIKENGNSGMFMRAPLVGRCSRIGFEFQVMGQDKDAPITNDVTGSIYDVKPPEGIFIHPDEWNEVEIQCIGTEVKIVWNGHLAHHFEYSEVEAMKNRAVSGYIGLQDHHNEVKFRNLRIKKLN